VAATALPVALLREVRPLTTAFMVQSRLGLAGAPRCPRIEHRWVDWDAISREAKLAVIAAEDQRFAEHRGFDFDAIRTAARERRAGGPRGASTISQQVAKNLFLWPGRSLLRKGLEAWFTVWIEALWPKHRILEVYLNVAQLGRCTFGIEAASRRYFDRPAAQLDADQAAWLAAALPSPTRLGAVDPPERQRERAAHVRRQMRSLGAGRLAELER
jgi:monofunctional biosynthetic peptidoglycan transglycosylase